MTSTSIKSVVAQVALVLDDRYWNESIILEHATRGYRQLNLERKYETKVTEIPLVDHKAQVPTDAHAILQLAIKDGSSFTPLIENSSTLFLNNCYHGCSLQCSNCLKRFHISFTGVITSDQKDATLVISYLAYPTDEDGYALIINDETVKEALLHYVLYRYWMQKYTMKEDGADSKMQFHLNMWSTLSKKALSKNLPTLSQLEKIKNDRSRLVHPAHSYLSFFEGLGSKDYNL